MAKDTRIDDSIEQNPRIAQEGYSLYLPIILRQDLDDGTITSTPTELPITDEPPITPTSTPTATSIGTSTSTNTPTSTITMSPTSTPTTTPTSTFTPTFTSMATSTSTPTNTPTSTVTMSPTSTSTVTPTLTPTPTQSQIPQPCNQPAQNFVLQDIDMPNDYSANEFDLPPLSQEIIDLGGVDHAGTEYINYVQLLTGTSGVTSLAIVFLQPAGSQGYLQLIRTTLSEDPMYTPISIPTIGDESIAYMTEKTESGLSFTIYSIYYRKSNIFGSLTTVALSPVANSVDAISFANLAVTKVCSN